MSSRDPAPGSLEKVRAFVNTLDVESGTDKIAGPDGLAGFLSEHDLLPADEQMGPDDVARAHQAREALRALLHANHDATPPPADAVARLNEAASHAQMCLRFAQDGSSVLTTEERGVSGAIGRILGIVLSAQEQGSWSRLKACRSDACQWAFYDHSKNRSSKWCSMAVCGNREKAKAYRRRHKAATA